MAWFTKDNNLWFTAAAVSWLAKVSNAWWSAILFVIYQATWDDSTVVWDSATSSWDAVSDGLYGNWYTKSPISWQSPTI